jgi:ribosome-binding protein aMBF1 (putative translation factor)
MLAVVKEPHTEISLNGDGVKTILALLRRPYEVDVLQAEKSKNNKEPVDLESTEWWRKNKCRVLAGARLKAGMTQQELAAKSGIKQSVICAYETGRRRITPKAAIRLAASLKTTPAHLLDG